MTREQRQRILTADVRRPGRHVGGGITLAELAAEVGLPKGRVAKLRSAAKVRPYRERWNPKWE